MGLDMYLIAERRFKPTPNNPRVSAILDAAGLDLQALKNMSEADPQMEDTYLYLSRWQHHMSNVEYQVATRIHELAETLPFATPDTGGGGLGYRDGEIFVNISCMYWRKANAIHDWFVRNCQDGVDDCGVYPVDPEALAYLRSTCEEAAHAYRNDDMSRACELLAPAAGFFFGSTELNEWWLQSVKHTVDEIDRVLTLAANTGGVSFSYHSSW